MQQTSDLLNNTGSNLGSRLGALHRHMLKCIPCLDRIGCAIYDKSEDALKTFINSTSTGEALHGYEYRMSDSHSLSTLAREGGIRFLPDLPAVLNEDTTHSAWLLKEGYKSSVTVPIYDQETFLGFIFFDSRQANAFSPSDQELLLVYSNLISLMLAHELLTIHALSGSVEVARTFCDLRDSETGSHIARMSRYSRLIAKNIAPAQGLTDEFVEHVFLFAPLHDIGKIGIPDKILLKPGKLDEQEWEIMKTHVSRGRAIIERMTRDLHLENLPNITIMRNIVEFHHKCLDGSGYPDTPEAVQPPIEARITAVADIFDALTTRRPYKEAWPLPKALEELERLANAGKLDRDCVAALKQHAGTAEQIRNTYTDTDTLAATNPEEYRA